MWTEGTVLLADHLRTLGYQHATEGWYLDRNQGHENPEKKRHFIESANDEVREVENDYHRRCHHLRVSVRTRLSIFGRGLQKSSRTKMMTNIATDTIDREMDNVEKSTASLNSIFIMADSGARAVPDSRLSSLQVCVV